jgi:excisionase family DNA binding protein
MAESGDQVERAYRRLAAAILLCCWEDLQGNEERAEDARTFLASEGAAALAEALGLDGRRVQQMAQAEIAPQPRGLLTYGQAAQRLGVTENRISMWVRAGRLGRIRGPGSKSVFVTAWEVEALARELH